MMNDGSRILVFCIQNLNSRFCGRNTWSNFYSIAVVIRTHIWAMTTWTNFNLILDLFELLVNTQNIITHKCWLLNIITILTKYFETIEVKHRRILKKVIGIVKKRMIKCKDMLYYRQYREMIYFSWATIIFVQPYNICFC
jgi:hypothetical protein